MMLISEGGSSKGKSSCGTCLINTRDGQRGKPVPTHCRLTICAGLATSL
jgi:hypothetical protein